MSDADGADDGFKDGDVGGAGEGEAETAAEMGQAVAAAVKGSAASAKGRQGRGLQHQGGRVQKPKAAAAAQAAGVLRGVQRVLRGAV